MKNLLIVVLALVTAASAQFKCPPKDGQYQDSHQCDKYYECIDGVAHAKLCPDGLVFDELIRKRNKCDQPFNIDCGDRIELQPAQTKGPCKRLNGFFAHENEAVCDKFYNCINGEALLSPCTKGLHFDELTGTCVWPATAEREGCSNDENTLKDGFKCPKETQKDPNGNVAVHPKYAHPSDCQRFYVCLNGVEPRDLGCQIGEVYNDESQKCDAPENVPGCEDWYKEDTKSSAPPTKKARK